MNFDTSRREKAFVFSSEAWKLLCSNGEMDAAQKIQTDAYPVCGEQDRFAGLEPNLEKHKVYNFEVADTHTYIAGGCRVHNTSTLSFYDPNENGVLTAVYEDELGRLVWESETPDGGKWVTWSTTDPNSPNTTTVTKEYTLGVLDENGNRVTRFYLKQESKYENLSGENVLVDIDIVDNYWLYGDEVGGSVANAVTPFILQSIGADSPLERLAAGTLIDAVIQNIAEGGLNAIHHGILYAETNGAAVGGMITDAWDDFGIDVAISGIDASISLVSQLIMGEIFASTDIDTIPEEIMAAVVQNGIDYVLETGVDLLIDSVFGPDSVLGQAFEPSVFDFTSATSWIALVLNVVLDDVLPQADTPEGALAGSLAHIFAHSLPFVANLGPALFAIPQLVIVAIIATAVQEIVDAIFDKDPQAFANMSFDIEQEIWKIDFISSDDGGNVALAEALGKAVSEQIEQFTQSMQSTDISFAQDFSIRIGHYEKHLRNGDGADYAMGGSAVVFATVVDALKNLSATDGDLKVIRALDLENIEQNIEGMTTGQAYSYLLSRLKMASDYHYYLNNTEFVNSIIVNAPDSALAKSWLATILAAEEMGLNDTYEYVGDATDNLVLTGDGGDTVSGGAGSDEIRTYGEIDSIFGGDGNDLISGGIGADVIDGGEGIDTVTFDDSGVAVSLDLSQGSGVSGDAEGDVYTSIEDIVGSNYSDEIIGDDNTNKIEGLSGADTLFGRGGNDQLYGNTGDDSIYGDLGADTSVSGNDTLYGNEGNDVLHGGGGFDTFDGGEGHDRASYRQSLLGVTASLAEQEAKISGGIETFTSIEGLIGSSHADVLDGDSAENTLEGLGGDDHLKGQKGADTYYYSLGDGNDHLIDWDSTAGTVDRLVFRDVLQGDVKFASTFGEDLIITLLNGERITIKDQFAESVSFSIEEIEFSDGTVLNTDEIRAKSVVDQKSNGAGTIVGTDFTESYSHSLGDGSYRISDFDNDGRIDRLVFTDVVASDVSFASKGNEDLVITLSNGERVTVQDHFSENGFYAIEEIEFSDGTVLNAEEIKSKSVSDQRAGGSGTVIGSDSAETYSHTLGDGSYQIFDWDSDTRTDRLVFTDVNASDVRFASLSNENLVITLSNGEQITVQDQFSDDPSYAIEEIEFADGTILGTEAIRAKSVADQKSNGSGTVIGTDHAETYTHAMGDGSYRISDWGDADRTDRLVFTDVNSDQVVFARLFNDLRIILPNGDEVTVQGQLGTSESSYIETFEFADGVTLSAPDVSGLTVASSEVAGYVEGGDISNAYTHALGDGSVVIHDYDQHGNDGTDSLTFSDLTVDQVNLSRIGNNLIFTLPNGEQVTLVRQLDENKWRSIENVTFSDGMTLTQDELRDRLVSDMKAGGMVIGTENSEGYVHTLGDGSYSITDYDQYNNSGSDSLTFTDVTADQVVLSRSGNDLIIRLPNGEQVTLVRQLDENKWYSIENVTFSDGATLTQHELRNRMVSDMKANGMVIGTENSEGYVHTLGDGSYSITDHDDLAQQTDSLTFTDVTADQVVLSRSGNDLIIRLPNGEQVTLVHQLDEDKWYSIENVTFSDGATLTQNELRNRMVSDMKAGGTVIGTENSEGYVHTLGDGSYSITDYDQFNNSGSDSLTFTDVTADQVVLSRSGNDLIIRLPNGEQVTLVRQLDEDKWYSIENVTFSDGATLTQHELRNRMVADMKAGGTVIGTENSEGYVHTLGDGSYSITDYDQYNNSGSDSLTFKDVTADQITLSRIYDDVVISLPSGETITLLSQLDESTDFAIETFVFADGAQWTDDQFRNRLMHDMKASGTVTGTVFDESYTHAVGDGSYTIQDYGSSFGNDRLAFVDLNREEVTVTRAGTDAVFETSGGEVITITGQFDSDRKSSIENIEFADGTAWNQQALIDAVAHDMKLSGTVVGSHWAETYRHNLGDGSYSVSTEENLEGLSDRLVFTDANSDQAFITRNGDSAIITLDNGEVITLDGYFAASDRARVSAVEFADGVIFDDLATLEPVTDHYVLGSAQSENLVGSSEDNILHGLVGDDHLRGEEGADTYRYAAGDGNDHITDYDNTAGVTDRLVFTDVVASDVSFASKGNEDLVITLSNGERVTVQDHFSENGFYAIEEIEFSDGTVLNAEEIKSKSVSDQRAGGSGTVIGSDSAETYSHTLGDGSYQIFDWDSDTRTDRLVFTDVNASDVRFASLSNENLVITLSNGEQITVQDQFSDDPSYAIEEIEFADGTILGTEAIRAKSVADQKSNGSGTVIGTDHAETYTHAMGDGSYRISDWGDADRTDRLVFTDVNSDQVVFARLFNDLRIILPNGDEVTVQGQLGTSESSYIETFEFADGVTLSAPDVSGLTVASSEVAGYVEGGDISNAYTHALGDGSVVIHDYDQHGNDGTDSLTFSDLTVDQVNLSRIGNNLIFTLPNGEQVTLVRQLDENKWRSIENVTFSDGMTLTQDELRDRLVSDMKAGGMVIGTENSEGYVHTLGDGSYSITDYDQYNNSGSDSLTFTDVTADQVVLSRSGNDLIIRLPNGEQVTLVRQLDENKWYSIENVTFSDGATLTQHELRNRMVSDMKANGMVIGTENSEGYVHTLGDGSYSITDHDDFAQQTDSLTFTDVTADQVVLSRSGNDLIIRLPNGEQVTLVGQLDEDKWYSIENVTFSDGATLTQNELRNRMVSDMKAGGTVIGTENSEGYVHTLGDGSYSITDYDQYNNSGSDSLTFTDVTADQVVLSRSGNDLIIRLPNGEQVTLVRQLDENKWHSIENVTFSDGATLTQNELRNRMVADMKAGGTVIGTENSEGYVHTLGDGSYSITDYDQYNNSGSDSLTFTDVTADQITVSRSSGSDLIISLENGEQITILNQLDANKWSSVEAVIFADGATLNQDELRNRMVADMKATGSVVGSENAEHYVHTNGDGSYTITDYDQYRNGGDDILTFADLTSDQVSFANSNGPEQNLVMVTEFGETIVWTGHFAHSNYALEEVRFSDGQTLTKDDIWMRSLLGGDGDDTIIGGSGSEYLSGGFGSDSLDGGSGHDTLEGGVGSDTLVGSTGDDSLTGGDGDDYLDGGDGNDTHIGGSGDDYVKANAGEDYFSGGDGQDTIDFTYSSDNFTIDLGGTTATFTSGLVEQVLGFEHLVAGSGNNELTGSILDNQIDGGLGSDTLNGGDGNDTLIGGSGNDFITGGDGNDAFLGGEGDDYLTAGEGVDAFDGGEGDDTIDFTYSSDHVSIDLLQGTAVFTGGSTEQVSGIENVLAGSGNNILIGSDTNNSLDGGFGDDAIAGGEGNDTLAGGEGNDRLDGGAGDDRHSGGAGADYLLGSLGDDFFDGGDGDDTIDFAYSDDDFSIDLSLEKAVFSDGVIEQVIGIENAIGGAGSNNLIGSLQGNMLNGGAGNDTLRGGGGNDVLEGGADADELQGNEGQDSLYGGDGNDKIADGAGDDLVHGGSGDDYLTAGAGADSFNGGEGVDTVDFGAETGSIAVDLALGTAVHEDGTTDQLLNLENIIAGTGNDTLSGDAIDNVFDGGAGNDDINAFGGNDTISGGHGDDFLSGGTGSDTYLYRLGDGNDTITDVAGDGEFNELVFTDVSQDQLIFSQAMNGDLEISVADGAVVQLSGFYSMPSQGVQRVRFSDGTVLDRQGMRDKTVADMKPSGAVYGTENPENYVHSRGDGSYSIFEADSSTSIDTLTFSDVNFADVLFAQEGNDLTISLDNGEVISIIDHFLDTGNFAVETVSFSDGTILNQFGIADAIAAALDAQASDDVFVETSGSDVFSFGPGMGNDQIKTSTSNNGEVDQLVFSDGLTVGDLYSISAHIGGNSSYYDWQIGLKNSAGTITILDDGYHGSGADKYHINEYVFSDGTVLTRNEFRLATFGTAGDDYFRGSGESDDFVFRGGEGNDQISETTASSSETDRLVFGDGITVDDLYSISAHIGGNSSYYDWQIGLKNSAGTITILDDGYHGSGADKYHINEYVFSDGTVLTRNEFRLATFGTAGDDYFRGSGESDDFVFRGGEGNDQISETTASSGETDRLVFGEGITLSEVFSFQSDVDGNGTDDLVIGLENNTGSVSILNAYNTSSSSDWYLLDEFLFEDGTTLGFNDFLTATLDQGKSSDFFV
ncbi:hypothetical protein KUV57_22660 [Epibacterium sp. DP7N7-1]|nr:hypothetical protein [Epibacterium sp. DP7N7-1]